MNLDKIVEDILQASQRYNSGVMMQALKPNDEKVVADGKELQDKARRQLWDALEEYRDICRNDRTP